MKRRKTPSTGKEKVILEPEVEEDYLAQIEGLREYWLALYEEKMGVPYALGSEMKQLKLCERLIDYLHETRKAKAYMTALLTRPELDWVDNKTLEWLAKPSNLTRVAPVLKKKKTKSRAEYSGDRPTETKIVFRSI